MKIVSFYEMAPDALSKVMDHYPAHRARLDEFHARGVLLMADGLEILRNVQWQSSPPVKLQRNSSSATHS